MRSGLTIDPLVVGYGAEIVVAFGEREVPSGRLQTIDGEEGVHMRVPGRDVSVIFAPSGFVPSALIVPFAADRS
jgi:hypothetical protein